MVHQRGFPCALIAQGEVTRLVPDEREDETQNCKCLGKCQAHEGEWLQLVLEFRLACDTLDEGSEHEAHANTTTDGGETVADGVEVSGDLHDFPFTVSAVCELVLGIRGQGRMVFLITFRYKAVCWLMLVGFRDRALDIHRGQQGKDVCLQNHDEDLEEEHTYCTDEDEHTEWISVPLTHLQEHEVHR